MYNDQLGELVDMLRGELVFPQERGKEYRMPVPIKLLDLVTIPNTRHLWPNEFDSLVKAWEETKSNDQLGIIADWLDDNDEPELAHAFRWCYRRNIRMLGIDYAFDCYIDKKHLPQCMRYNGDTFPVNEKTGIPGLMAHIAGMFAEIREVIA